MAWFETWFNTPYYHILYDNRNFTEAERFISSLTAHLQLPQNSKVVDLACGRGRHSVFLNHLGYDVLGLDLSTENIAHNQRFVNNTLHFEVHDMRDPISLSEVDAIFSLFTSFGYFDDPKDDEKVFISVHHALRTDGYFVLDFLNETFVENNLVPEMEVKKQGISFKIRKKIENHHIIKEIQFEDQGETFQFYEKVKLHTKEEIETLANKVGFNKIGLFGNYSLEAFDLQQSPRCISIFQKR